MAEDVQGAAPPAPTPSDTLAPPSTDDGAQTPISREQQAISAIGAEAARKQLDESPFPGGRFLVNGRYVDAEGRPHKNQKDA